MRHEPIELGRVGLASRAADDRVARLATRLARFVNRDTHANTFDVVDAAFAKLAGTDSRVARIDTGCPATSPSGDQAKSEEKPAAGMDHFTREIFADLSAQLHTLDEQRDRLAELLRNIDRNSIGQ
jgi:hypothetical protein